MIDSDVNFSDCLSNNADIYYCVMKAFTLSARLKYAHCLPCLSKSSQSFCESKSASIMFHRLCEDIWPTLPEDCKDYRKLLIDLNSKLYQPWITIETVSSWSGNKEDRNYNCVVYGATFELDLFFSKKKISVYFEARGEHDLRGPSYSQINISDPSKLYRKCRPVPTDHKSSRLLGKIYGIFELDFSNNSKCNLNYQDSIYFRYAEGTDYENVLLFREVKQNESFYYYFIDQIDTWKSIFNENDEIFDFPKEGQYKSVLSLALENRIKF